jgi:hypothetical protein
MKYNFKEKQLDHDFAKEYSEYVRKLIEASISFSIVGLPRVCISSFLRFTALQKYAHFVYVDVRVLSSRTKQEFFKLVLERLGYSQKIAADEDPLKLCTKQLALLLKTYKKIVIIINRFDHLNECIDRIFLSNLQSLYDVDRRKIVFITTASKPLYELPMEVIAENNMELFSKVVYFRPFTEEDMKMQLKIHPLELRTKEELPLVMKLAGGHINLMQLLLKTDYLSNPLQDPFVRFQMQMIYADFTPSQQRQLQHIVKGKDGPVDEFLYKIGVIKKENGKIVFFSPLMEEYITSLLPQKLSGKESKLFHLLKKNMNKVVLKDAIFTHVWKDEYEEATDWALNSLIYRLRKNPVYLQSGYDIESYKGMGYKLVKKN